MMVSFSAINDEICSDENEQINCIKNCGIKYLEIRRVNGKYLHEVDIEVLKKHKNALDSNNIIVSAIDSPIGKNHIFNMSNYDLIVRYVNIAKIYNCNRIRIFGKINDEGKEENIKDITKMAELCLKNDIVLLIENEKGTNICNYSDIKEYEAIFSKNIKLLFDVCNFYIEGDDCFYNLKNTYEHIGYFHFRNCMDEDNFVLLDSGKIDYTKIVDYINKQGYEGIVSLESHMTKGLREECKKEVFLKAALNMKKMFA